MSLPGGSDAMPTHTTQYGDSFTLVYKTFVFGIKLFNAIPDLPPVVN